jgi:hypothetical protein
VQPLPPLRHQQMQPAEPAAAGLPAELLPWLVGLVAVLLLLTAATAIVMLIRQIRRRHGVAVPVAAVPDFQPTVAMPAAAAPDFQPTVAMPAAAVPDFQPTVAMPGAAVPDFQPTVAVPAAPAATLLHPPRTDATHPGLPPAVGVGRWVVMVVSGDDAGQLELNRLNVRYRLGRATGDRRPDLPLHHPRVSREHADIVLTGDGPLLIAGASAHGTYVGPQRDALVPGEQRLLRSGAQIWLSPDVELRLIHVPADPEPRGGYR